MEGGRKGGRKEKERKGGRRMAIRKRRRGEEGGIESRGEGVSQRERPLFFPPVIMFLM